MSAARWPRAVLFDLDGTLVDTVPDLAACVDRTLAELGVPARGEAAVRTWVGNGVERLIDRALAGRMEGGAEPGLRARALARFLELYERHACERSRPYPGAAEALARLHRQGIRLACVTNKPQRPAEALLAHFGLDAFLERVVGGGRLAHVKPHPEPLLHALAELAVEPGAAVMVGDSSNDVAAARAAGIAVVCVGYGYNHGRDIRECAPDAVIERLADLEQALAGLAPRAGPGGAIIPATETGSS